MGLQLQGCAPKVLKGDPIGGLRSCSLGEWHPRTRPWPQRDSKSIVYILKSSPKLLNVSGSWEVGKLSEVEFTIETPTIVTTMSTTIGEPACNNPGTTIGNLTCFFFCIRRFFSKLCVKIGTYSSIFGQPKNSTGCWWFFGDQRLKVLEISLGGWVVPWFLYMFVFFVVEMILR